MNEQKDTGNAVFPKEKVLTMKAGEYLDNMNISKGYYEFVGVHGVMNASYHLTSTNLKFDHIPEGTKVITDFRHSIGGDRDVAYSGTALVRKPEKKE
jgi:hypothetical protein